MTHYIRVILFLLLIVCGFRAASQNANLTVQSLAGMHVDSILQHHLVGEGVVITNGKFNNNSGNVTSSQIGTFNRNNFTTFPFATGLVMTTGNVSVAAGPNNAYDASSSTGVSAYYDPSLSSIATDALGHCATLEFDFQTNSDSFAFRYVFGSEEYCEYVNTEYNDVFAFLLTGPDPVTLIQTTRNVAVIPGSVSYANPNGLPVAINNVNHGFHSAESSGPGTNPSYSQYFIHNNAVNGIQYDGYTVALTAHGNVQPCQNYHMKLSIGNVGDNNYDSGVFLEEHSFESAPDPSISVNSFYCLHDDIVFEYSAQNVDSVHIITPSGDTLWQAPYVIHDALAADSGYYCLRAKRGFSCQGDLWLQDSVKVVIRIPCVAELCSGASICSGQEVAYPYAYDSIVGPWVNYVNESLFTIAPPAALQQDTSVLYLLSMYDEYGCHFDTTVTVHFSMVKNTSFDTVVCDAFLWNGTSYTVSGEYTQTLTQQTGSCDSVVVAHVVVNQNVANVDTLVLVENQLPYHYASADTTIGPNSPATSQFVFTLPTHLQCDSVITMSVFIYYNTEQTIDTTVCATDLPYVWHGHTFATAGSVRDTLLSVNGNDSVVVYQLDVDEITAAVGDVTHVLCYGGNTGGATAVVNGGLPPMSCQWTNASGTTLSATAAFSNCPVGDYTFTVTDQLGCPASATVTINHLNADLVSGQIAANQDICIGTMPDPFTGTSASGGDNGSYQWQITSDGDAWTTAPGVANMQNYTYPSAVLESFFLRRAWISQSCGTVYSDTLAVVVQLSYQDTVTAAVCQYAAYQDNGFDITAEETAEPGEFQYQQNLSTGYCDSVITLILTVFPKYETFVEAVICEGDGFQTGEIVVPAEETVGVDTLTRTASLQSVDGCDSVVYVSLTLIDTMLRIVPLTEDFCQEMSAELMVVTPMVDYQWNTGERMPNITVMLPGVYSVTASQGTCTVTAHITIPACDIRLYLPNAITPSKSDGLNDAFCIPELAQRFINNFEISVFNRWGEQVFYSTDKTFRWDGTINGRRTSNVVYTYIIRYTDANGKPYVATGTVTVL